MFHSKDKKEKKDKKDKRGTLNPAKLQDLVDEHYKQATAPAADPRQLSRSPSNQSTQSTQSAAVANGVAVQRPVIVPAPGPTLSAPALTLQPPVVNVVPPVQKDTYQATAISEKPKDYSPAKSNSYSSYPIKSSAGLAGRPKISVDTEIQSLENVKTDSSSSDDAHQRLYQQYTRQVYQAYDRLQSYARDCNTHLTVPEVVFVGRKGQGKSSLIEAFLGEPVNALGNTKRPVFFNLVNNPAVQTPKITVKRDLHLKQFDRDVEITTAELSAELSKRTSTATDEPVFVQWESFRVTNITYIDTPAIENDEAADNIVYNLARPSNRLVIYVESANDWFASEPSSFIKRVDSEYSRTTFVYTNFNEHLTSLDSTREVNKYLGGSLPDVKTFFVTIPSEEIRGKFNDADGYQKKVFQYVRRDLNTLEQLSYDKRFEAQIGVHSARQYTLDQAWRSYEESIPRVLKQLRLSKNEKTKQIKELESQLAGLDTSKLRTLSSNYVITFLQAVEKLISGTSEGNPAVNGQTLEEEKADLGDGDWLDHSNRPIRFEPASYNILYWDNKLYGGQQFERLLSEFKGVAEHIQISAVSINDVATAAGINKLNNIPNYHWAASDLAQQKSQDAFLPLIEQLTIRAVYIMKRLSNIARAVLDSRKKKNSSDPHDNYTANMVENVDHYKYFTNHVEDLYFRFIEQTAKSCREKAMDEFYSTRTIYWESISDFGDRSLPLDRSGTEETKSSVENMATELFANLKERITKNVLLKFYNFFLVPIQTELWNEIQSRVNTLSDTEFEQYFEVSDTKDKLEAEIKHLNAESAQVTEKEQEFIKYAAAFAKREKNQV